MKSTTKILPRRRRTTRRQIGLNEPRAMTTVRTRGKLDPPPTSTQIVGFKRLRKLITLSGTGTGQITVNEISGCLPLATNNSEFRILKMSVWGTDGSSGASSTHTANLSCVFPVSNNAATPFASTPGDNSTWEDDGVFGQARPAIHLIPAFDYRNYWLSPIKNGPNAIVATFVQPIVTAPITVDFSVQFRTVVQSCPALDYLNQIRSAQEPADVEDYDCLVDNHELICE